MPLDDRSVLAVLRHDRGIGELCAAVGATEAEFLAARDAWLTRQAAPRDRRVHAAVTSRVEILRDRAGVPHIFADATGGRVFRSRLAHGRGPAVADGPSAPPRARPAGRNPRRRVRRRPTSRIAPSGITAIAREATRSNRRRAHSWTPSWPASTATSRRIGASCRPSSELLGYEPEPFTVRDVIAIAARACGGRSTAGIDRIMRGRGGAPACPSICAPHT